MSEPIQPRGDAAEPPPPDGPLGDEDLDAVAGGKSVPIDTVGPIVIPPIIDPIGPCFPVPLEPS